MNIGDRIRYIREENQLSRMAFGKKLGVSGDVINNIESNRLKKPEQKEPIYKLICEKFNVNEIWLKTGEGDPFDELPEMDEESAYIESLMMEKDDEFIDAVKALLKVYCKMDDLSKKVFKQAAKDWIAEMNKGTD